MPLKVLLIEDDEEVCEELKVILGSHHHEVAVVHRALEGIDMIKG